MKTSTWTAQLTVASSKAQHYLNSLCTTPKRPPSTSKFYVDFKKRFFKDQKIETHLLFLDVLCLVWHFFELKDSRVRSFYLPRTHKRSSDSIFLHTRDFSLSKVTALKEVWGKDTSRRSKEPASDLPSCFLAWAPFYKCGWRHHISRSGCGPDCLFFAVFVPPLASRLNSERDTFLSLFVFLLFGFFLEPLAPNRPCHGFQRHLDQ